MARNGYGDHTITDDLKPAPYTPPADGWREVRAADVPPAGNGGHIYADLLLELVKRLEMTPAGKALQKSYATRKDAVRAASSLRNHILRHQLPHDAIILAQRGADLYVMRGPSFKQLEIGPDGRVRRWQMPEED